MEKLKAPTLCIFGLLMAFLITGCREADYPYFIHGPATARLKPVFLIIVDTSGSNQLYLSAIYSLVEEAKSFLLENLYNGNREVMDQHLFVGTQSQTQGGGEDWVGALIKNPTALVSTQNTGIDTYPNRIVLFFGNGAGVTDPLFRDAYQISIDNFTTNILPGLDFYMARLIITPGADFDYTNWAQCVIDGTCIIPGILPIDPPMADYNWSYTQYEPTTVGVEYFLNDIMQAINKAL